MIIDIEDADEAQASLRGDWSAGKGGERAVEKRRQISLDEVEIAVDLLNY